MSVEPDLSRIHWIHQSLKIIDKHGKFVSLRPNSGQLLLHTMIQQQRGRGLPVRVVLLKPRQVGWSTWTEAEAFHDVYHNPNTNAMAVSVDSDSTDVIFGMTKRFHESMRGRKATDNTNKKAIIYSAPHRSSFYAQTAGKVGVGRSFQARFLHCSEVAFWADAATQLAGLYQMVPNDEGTVVILESTANGIGGAFYDAYMRAKENFGPENGYRGYMPVFFPWYQHPEYKERLPEGFSVTDEEEELKALYGLSNEQVFWRRLKVEELRGDESIFRQEYPSTDLEAFVASGNPVFTQKMISDQERNIVEPRTCVFSGDQIEDVNREFNCWFINFLPVAGRLYVMGIDTMEGRLSDVADPKSRLDKDGIVIFDRMTGDVCAVWNGRGPSDDVAEQALWAAEFYNQAFVAMEMPAGMTVLKHFHEQGYENLYNRQVHDERIIATESEDFGWRTTIVTRGWLVDSLITAFRSGAVKVFYKGLIDEMKTFIRDKTGKPVHMPSKHDDMLFALGIALQIHLRVPMDTTVLEPAAESRSAYDSLSFSGAIDNGPEFDDDSDMSWSHTN